MAPLELVYELGRTGNLAIATRITVLPVRPKSKHLAQVVTSDHLACTLKLKNPSWGHAQRLTMPDTTARAVDLWSFDDSAVL